MVDDVLGTDFRPVVEGLSRGGHPVVVACSGGGAGIADHLWRRPGASDFLLGTYFPYAREALKQFCGRDFASYCSEESAVCLATKAFSEGLRMLWDANRVGDRQKLIAVGM